MSDSGITPDLETLLLSGEDLDMGEFYEIKSKVVVGSPVQDIKHSNMPMRANLRQQLQRQQMYDEQKKEEEYSQQMHPPQSQIISVPATSNAAVSTEVPPKVLEVKSSLQFPTKYHIQESQKRQVVSFLNNTEPAMVGFKSMPAMATGLLTEFPLTNSAPDMSTGMGEQVGDIFFESTDPSADHDLNLIEPTLNQLSSTMPQENFLFVTDDTSSASAKTATSAPAAFRKQERPAFMTAEQEKMWQKERQKKDNHNMIERKRRFNINDRIKDLGELLPKSIELERQNKGSILKASVSYIQHLQRDQEKKKLVEEKNKELNRKNFQLQLKLKQATAMLKQAGLGEGFVEDHQVQSLIGTADPMDSLMPSISLPSTVDQSDLFTGGYTDETFMEDSPVASDPMLGSTPGSPLDVDSTSSYFQN